MKTTLALLVASAATAASVTPPPATVTLSLDYPTNGGAAAIEFHYTNALGSPPAQWPCSTVPVASLAATATNGGSVTYHWQAPADPVCMFYAARATNSGGYSDWATVAAPQHLAAVLPRPLCAAHYRTFYRVDGRKGAELLLLALNPRRHTPPVPRRH